MYGYAIRDGLGVEPEKPASNVSWVYLRTRRAVLTGIEGDTWSDHGGYIKAKQICKNECDH